MEGEGSNLSWFYFNGREQFLLFFAGYQNQFIEKTWFIFSILEEGKHAKPNNENDGLQEK